MSMEKDIGANAPRNWLITGVSSGLGRALAETVLAVGDTVWGGMRRPEQVAAFESLAPGRAHALIMDVTQPVQIKAMVDHALATGPIHVLVNNAGVGMIGTVEETSVEEARSIFETNFFGLLQVTKTVLPSMRRRGCGRIVNVSSGVGLQAIPGMPLYSASKHAVEGLTEALAAEVSAMGIQVSLVEPGAILTNFVGPSMTEAVARMPEYGAFTGLGRAGLAQYYQAQASTPEQVAAVILELVNSPAPPLRRLVGDDVTASFRDRLAVLQAMLSPE